MKTKLFVSILLSLFFGLSIHAQWQSIGPYGGLVKCFDTTASSIVAGTSGGGVYITSNNGGLWVPVNTGLTNLDIQAVAVGGSNIFAGTNGGGIFLSTNNGSSWTAVNNGLTDLVVSSIAISGSNIYAGTTGSGAGVFLSTNNGGLWTLVNTGFPAGVYVMSLAVSGSNVFAGTGTGVYISSNNGGLWTAVNSGLGNLYVDALTVSGTKIYAGTNTGVYISANNGGLWAGSGTPSGLVKSIAVKGTNIFTAGASGVNLSVNNGANWNAVNTGITTIWVNCVKVKGGAVFAGTDGDGVFKTTNNGTSWTQTSVGLSNLNTPALAVSGTNVFAGAFLGGVFLSGTNTGPWTTINTGITNTAVQALAANGSTIFAGTSGSGGGVFYTANNGTSWAAVNSGLTNNDVTSLAIAGTTVFAGTFGGGMFKSANNGGLWTAANTGLTNTSVQALTVSGTNIFAGVYYGGVFLSSNNGGNWAAVNTGLTNTNVNALTVSGTTIFAGTFGGVFASTNNGTSWTAMNTGLTNHAVLSLAAKGTNLFAGTDGGGVFYSTDMGNTWTAINTALANLHVYSLAVNDSNVFAGTHGDAVWTRPLSDLLVPAIAGVSISQTGGTNPTCEGQSVTFTAVPVNGGSSPSYQWQVDGVNAGTDNASFAVSTLTNGQTVTCIMTSNMIGVTGNPASSNSIILNVNPAPPMPVISQNGLVLTSSAVSGNQWYLNGTLMAGETNQTLTVLADGNYTVAVTLNGCTSVISAAVLISNQFNAAVSISQTKGTNPMCAGLSATFTAVPVHGGTAPSYQWKKNGVNVGTDTVAYVTTSLANGDVITCVMTSNMPGATGNPAASNAITMTVTAVPPVPVITQNGTVLTSSAASGNQWYLNGQLIVGAVNQTYTLTQNGNYTVIVTINACSSPGSSPVTITTTEIGQAANDYLFNVYPNPNNGTFNILFNTAVKAEYVLELKNELGQVVYHETLTDFSGQYSKQMNLSRYGKGIYLISLSSTGSRIDKKVVLY